MTQTATLLDFPIKGQSEILESTLLGEEPEPERHFFIRTLGADDHIPQLSSKKIDIETLYSGAESVSSDLQAAMKLLKESLHYFDEADEAYQAEDIVAMDDAMQHFQGLLPEIFCCRTLGDGFGALINALHYSLFNLKGVPPSKEQIDTMRHCVETARNEPFIAYDTAVEMVDRLEKANLSVDPPEMGALLDMMDE